MSMPTNTSELEALVTRNTVLEAMVARIPLLEYELAGFKAENAVLKEKCKQKPNSYSGLLDSLLAGHASKQLVKATPPPKPKRNHIEEEASDDEDEPAHGPTAMAESKPTPKAKPKPKPCNDYSDTDSENEADTPSTTRGTPTTTPKAPKAPLESAIAKKYKLTGRDMFNRTKMETAKRTAEKQGRLLTHLETEEVAKCIEEKWKKSTAERKAYYQSVAEKDNCLNGA